jgi:hypothetical protein
LLSKKHEYIFDFLSFSGVLEYFAKLVAPESIIAQAKEIKYLIFLIRLIN